MSDCIFCKIVEGTIPAERVFEDEHFLAFRDLNPQAPTHVLVIPKEHIPSLDEVADDQALLLGKLFITAKHLARELGVSEQGYRVVNNCKGAGGQTVDHLHIHLLGGRNMQWPPG